MTAPAPNPVLPQSAVADLLPRAVDLAIELGELPARTRLMTDLKVGAPKARMVRDALSGVDWAFVKTWTQTDPDTAAEGRTTVLRIVTGETPGDAVSTPHLHAVPDPEPTTDTEPADTGADTDHTPAPPEPAPHETPDQYSATVATETQLTAPEEQTSATPEPEPVMTAAETSPAPSATTMPAVTPDRRPVVWPVLILCLPAFVAIWAGWVEMGRLTGFGKVALLPGIADNLVLNTAITLPIGVETYAAYALWVWLSGRVAGQARRFAKWSAIGSLITGAAGQVAYHLMTAWGWTSAPWPVTAAVACIPVAVLGMGAGLAHLMHQQH